MEKLMLRLKADEFEVSQLLAMTDDRNLTSHTYVETIAEAIYEKLPAWWRLLQQVHDRIVGQVTADSEDVNRE